MWQRIEVISKKRKKEYILNPKPYVNRTDLLIGDFNSSTQINSAFLYLGQLKFAKAKGAIVFNGHSLYVEERAIMRPYKTK